MKNVLIKSFLLLSITCCCTAYSALTFEVKPSKGTIKLQKKNQQINNSADKNVMYLKSKNVNKDLKDIKNSNNKDEDKSKKQTDNNTILESDSIKLTISGQAAVSAAGTTSKNTYYNGEKPCSSIKTDQKSKGKTKLDGDGVDLVAGEAELDFDVKGKLNNGNEYGASIVINAEKSDIDIDKMYVYLKNECYWGHVICGNLKGPDDKYVFSGQKLLEANFGVDGIINSHLEYATAVLKPRGPVGFSNKATKLVYYSPTFAGFQLGFSYTPDTRHVGHEGRNQGSTSLGKNQLYEPEGTTSDKLYGLHNVAAGIKYDKDFGNGFKLKAGFVFVNERTQALETECYTGDITEESKPETKTIQLNNANDWIASLSVTYKKLTLAFGYYRAGKSRLPKLDEYENNRMFPTFMVDKDGDSGHAWNIGVKYELTDNWSVTAVFHDASRKTTADEKATAKVLTLATDYKINKNFKVFAEIDVSDSKSSPYACSIYNLLKKEDKNKTAIIQNKSLLFSTGIELKF